MMQLIRCLLLLLLCATFTGPAFATQEAPVLTDLSKPVVLSAGQADLVLYLKSNPTTGFQWMLKNYDHNVLTLVSHQYMPPSNPKLMGAPGTDMIRFHVNPTAYLMPQTGVINFVYARPWEPIPATEVTVTWVSAAK